MNLDNYDGKKIVIRPSSVDTFFNCAYQWASVFLGGENSIPGARAAIGTAIHTSAEVIWSEAIKTGNKDPNIEKLNDAAIESLKELDKKGLAYDKGEDLNTAEKEVLGGVSTFVGDIVPFTDIPKFVEKRFTLEFEGHPIVKSLSGTVDYLSTDLADVKTSKRKISAQGHVTQQSIYKLLAEHNGHTVNNSLIQGVVLNKNPYGEILQLEPNIPKVKHMVNTILDTLEVFNEGKVAPEVLFRGNPKYYLCSPKYCNKHSTCPFVNGEA